MGPDYTRHYARTDFRKHPERYRIGRGEQGVLMAEPYKSEILPHWRFRTPAVARASAAKIYRMFLAYRARRDFVGMDMARKFLQMGFTRARRYANHRSGRKYAPGSRKPIARRPDADKARSARIFKVKWDLARKDRIYLRLKAAHRARQTREVRAAGRAGGTRSSPSRASGGGRGCRRGRRGA
ncbi:MAG TPA: DUF4385 domain-containing protein [Steroidobacteraceae bacterium]|nr:DUF4385 domain-containing protein [Steroidobacteraceae bacterium]